MTRPIQLLLTTLVLMLSPMVAGADGGQQACLSLGRSNIDCTCVAKRLDVFERASPASARPLIREGYLYSLGKPNAYEDALQSVMTDIMAYAAMDDALGPLGGRPQNIVDYEEGCVITGAPKAELPILSKTPVAEDYVSSCVTATGDERTCSCQAAQLQSHLSDRELEAYLRSFNDYSDDAARTLEELSAMRGRSMGLSAEAYDSLVATARSKIRPNEEADANYCSALVWADSERGQTAAERQLAGFEPGAVNSLPSDVGKGARSGRSLGVADRARAIVSKACAQEGNSEQYCACYMADYDIQVAAQVPRPEVALAWALMNADAGLSSAERIKLTQSLSKDDHMAAGLMIAETSDLGSQCQQTDGTATAPLKGTPKGRMRTICMAENDDAPLCDCMTNKMDAELSAADFELIVDLREAEFNGADDPLSEVAASRGQSISALEGAISRGQGTMAINLMSCMGGMNGLPQFPGLPVQ